MKTRSNMPLFVVECSDVKALTKDQIDLLRCGDYLVKKDSSGEHAYKVTFKKEGVGMCLTYTDASVIETQSYDYVDGAWVYNSEDKTPNLLETNKLEEIVDKDGHKRFIEGDIELKTITGVSKLYGKWSLSGTHLMIALCLQIESGNAVADNTTFADIYLPQWVMDKIVPIAVGIVENKSFNAYTTSFSSTNFNCRITKSGDTKYLAIMKSGAYSSDTYTRTVRIAYDLLIDNE